MKKVFVLFFVILVSGFPGFSYASDGYNTQKGAVIGAVGGALAGQAIGHNTTGTLMAAAGGALGENLLDAV